MIINYRNANHFELICSINSIITNKNDIKEIQNKKSIDKEYI